MKNRRERREEARKNKTKFEPQYKSAIRRIPAHVKQNEDGTYTTVEEQEVFVGGEPRPYNEVFGTDTETTTTE
ncbi:hypothetical protein X915_gp246 [Bacillus phage vB_BanS-Tsamsa]|uniref:Uncharacterized protein n=2 Tax=Caudoviricetes TaxID=2731619 RepID=U5J9S4_9CAUD|nr:hypothetical protein X915_gp246 [Bacillus phage vB_BanS-Tsamsa]AGI11926.1 hypothetical protein [Bacillus phage vB_BanS-Tsamsa]